MPVPQCWLNRDLRIGYIMGTLMYKARALLVVVCVKITTHSTLAQLVERATVNRVVPGSSPGGGAKKYIGQITI